MNGERYGAFHAFGGLCGKLKLVAIAPDLCVAGNVGFGLAYFAIFSSRLEGSARMRIIDPGDFSSLLRIDQLGVNEKARRELSLSVRSAAPKGHPDATPFVRAQGGSRSPIRLRGENSPPQYNSGNPPHRRARNTFNTNAPAESAQ